MRTAMVSKVHSDSIAMKLVWVIIMALAQTVASSSALNIEGQHVKRDSCDSQPYRDLLALRDAQNCIGENQVWGMLHSIYYATNGSYCMHRAITLMSAIFSDPKHNPDYCTCSGSNTLRNDPDGYSHNTQDCAKNDHLYVYLYERHFHMDHTKYYQQPPHCSTHHSVWPALASISSDMCRDDIALHVASMFHYYGDQCFCSKKTEVTSDPCDSRPYRDLLALRDTHNCIGENQVWGMLNSIYYTTNGSYCMKQAITLMSAIFSDPKHNPDYCACTGSNQIRNNPTGFSQHPQDCSKNDQLYVYLFERHFHMEHTKYYQQPPYCSTHHSVWPALASIGSDICRSDIVLQVASMFRTSGDHCHCSRKTEGSVPQQPMHPSYQTTPSPILPSNHCLQYPSYTYLYNLSINVDLCVNVNKMWLYLADLQHKDTDCRREIMTYMGSIFHAFDRSPDYCSCTGHNIQHNTISLQNLDQNYCKMYHEEYKVLHDEIYSGSPPPCRSHQYLWGKLLRINVGELERDCRADLILHAAATFERTASDPCSCSHAAGSPTVSVMPLVPTSVTLPSSASNTGATSFTMPSNASSTGATSFTLQSNVSSTGVPTSVTLQSNTSSTGASAEISTSLPATNTPTPTIEHVTDQTLSGLQVCRKTSTIITIAHNITVSHPGASICMTGDHNSSEALVLICCNANSTASWTKGENVMEFCNRIPLYTPIATFKPDGVYESNEWTSGIFLGCIPNGFKFVAQDCISGIHIKHLESGGMLGNNDVSSYYVVRW